jgi:circadian clock protein KaiC
MQGLHLHSVVHGILNLEQRRMFYGVVRHRLSVLKLRGTDFRSGYHDYVIRTGGIEAWPSLLAGEHETEFNTESLSSGISSLDELLGGGLWRGPSTLLIGPSGVGKSSLALQYAVTATQRGARAAVFAFDESYRTALCGRAARGSIWTEPDAEAACIGSA